jgi:hypothetical protein
VKRLNHESVLIANYMSTFMEDQNYSSDNVGTVFIDDWKQMKGEKREIRPILES